jgi:hypothetical protein
LYIIADVFNDQRLLRTPCASKIEQSEGTTAASQILSKTSNNSKMHGDPLLECYSLYLVEGQSPDTSLETSAISVNEYTCIEFISDL